MTDIARARTTCERPLSFAGWDGLSFRMAAQADQITVTVSLEVDDEVAVILVAVDVEEIHAFAGGVNAGPIFQRQPE